MSRSARLLVLLALIASSSVLLAPSIDPCGDCSVGSGGLAAGQSVSFGVTPATASLVAAMVEAEGGSVNVVVSARTGARCTAAAGRSAANCTVGARAGETVTVTLSNPGRSPVQWTAWMGQY